MYHHWGCCVHQFISHCLIPLDPCKSSLSFFHKMLLLINLSTFLSHRIIDSFLRILKWEIIRLTPVLVRANKTGRYKFYVFLYINIRGKLSVIRILCRIFSVWLRTGSDPADINRVWSHTENFITSLINNNRYVYM